jgi:hypothetical protein
VAGHAVGCMAEPKAQADRRVLETAISSMASGRGRINIIAMQHAGSSAS